MLAPGPTRSSQIGRKRPISRKMSSLRRRRADPRHRRPAKYAVIDTSRRGDHRRGVAAQHLFVCTNERSSGKPACGRRGGHELVTAVQHALLARGATEILVTPCGCLGPCFDGPNAVVYPDGVWYADLNPADATAIVDHLIDGVVLTTKISGRPGGAAEAIELAEPANPDRPA